MDISLLTWLLTAGVLLAILGVDLFLAARRPHEPSMKESAISVSIYVALAVAFGAGLFFVSGAQYAGEFFAGWITEYSLSIDNLFMFIIIMARLKVPRKLQSFALMIGIVLALVFRAIFIALGAAMIHAWAWVFFLFGAFLIYTAVHLAVDYFQKDTDEEATDNAVVRMIKRLVPQTDEFHGTRLFTRAGGRRLMTPMFLVILALGSTDIMFALDSIPAIYGLTQEPYLVFVANVFALMGLRQLYFLLGGLLKRLKYLSLGLSFILAFIGVKLLLHAFHATHLDAKLGFTAWEVPTWLSLVVILATIAITTVISLIASRNDPTPDLGVDGPDQEPIVEQARELYGVGPQDRSQVYAPKERQDHLAEL